MLDGGRERKESHGEPSHYNDSLWVTACTGYHPHLGHRLFTATVQLCDLCFSSLTFWLKSLTRKYFLGGDFHAPLKKWGMKPRPAGQILVIHFPANLPIITSAEEGRFVEKIYILTLLLRRSWHLASIKIFHNFIN